MWKIMKPQQQCFSTWFAILSSLQVLNADFFFDTNLRLNNQLGLVLSAEIQIQHSIMGQNWIDSFLALIIFWIVFDWF